MPAVDGGLDPLPPSRRSGITCLAGEVPALLGKHLILDLDAGRAGALEHAHGATHVDRIAEAGVGIDQQRQRHDIGDRGDRVGDLGQRGQPDVRDAERMLAMPAPVT